jgi:hypothetical protein
MAEQTFKSPGFFDTETVRERNQNLEQIITTVPAGIAGFSEKGPAFVPTTVHSYERFVEIFGEAKPEYPSTLAAKKFLENRDALTFVRVLGAGANTLGADFTETERIGTVKNAGFVVTSSAETTSNKNEYGLTQFICAEHAMANNEASGYPIFASNNNTLSADPFMVRGVLLTTSGSKFTVIDHDEFYDSSNRDFTAATSTNTATEELYKKFKLVLQCSDTSIGSTDGFDGVKIFSASLDPNSDSYISKILNTDPSRFQIDKHLLYAHFPVEEEIATLQYDTSQLDNANVAVGLASGSEGSSSVTGELFSSIYGNFQSRYQAPRTTSFISQPFGETEYDLFHFECIDDGKHSNDLFKVSISGIKKTDDPEDPYPLFNVELRSKRDLDTSPQVIESYVECNLNPNSDNFISKKIGDMKISYNFDTEDVSERRLLITGQYPNISSRIRVVLSEDIINESVPKDAAPFGFRGLPHLKTSDYEPSTSNIDEKTDQLRFSKVIDGTGNERSILASSILPPVPFRFKVTTGEAQSSPNYVGESSLKEGVSKALYWGIKFERVPIEGEITNPILRSNESIVYNELLDNLSKFQGIEKLDALLTGSGADDFNHNKFTLSRVALGKFLNDVGTPPVTEKFQDYTPFLTGSAKDLMKDAAYLRNGSPRTLDGTITESGKQRLTFASLMSLTSSVYFNRFTEYAKFTNMFYGGFDGTNILDPDMSIMNDKAASSDSGGKGVNSPDIGLNMSFGSGDSNATVNSYKEAVNLLTDSAQSRINLLSIPGIRSDELLSHAIDRVEEYSKALLLMDVPHFDTNSNRLYDDSSASTNTRNTVEEFAGRNYDTSYAAAYFPDVVIDDDGKRIKAPATVAALAAIGYNDNTSFPWFAPAGFNRGSLGFVKSSKARLNKEERDVVYEGRINPISTFPKNGYVIFGQKTLQRARTSLDRVNVRRMLLEVKRVVADAAIGFIFEANTPEVRSAFKKKVDDRLITVQENQGIDQFKVIIDSTNNSQSDIDNNVLNGRIVLVPTRTIEFISIDFVISNSGVDFV